MRLETETTAHSDADAFPASADGGSEQEPDDHTRRGNEDQVARLIAQLRNVPTAATAASTEIPSMP
jgi:hypothetical protein